MSFPALQAAFFSGVVEGPGPELIGRLKAPPRGNVLERFAIYRDGFGLRMREFLRADYPALLALIGDDAFDALVEAYVRKNPSGFRNARWVGAALPLFLRQEAAFADRPLWGDVAALEAALLENFDGADVCPLTLADLAGVAPEQVGALRFDFAPTMAMLRLRRAAVDAFVRFRDGQGPLDAEDPTFCALLVWRRGVDVLFRVLEPDEAEALGLARGGARFEQICAASDANAAAGLLAKWFDDQIIVAATVD